MQMETFDSQDLGEVEAFVSRIYSRMHIGAVGERTRARIDRRPLTAEVAFDDLDYSFDIGYAAEPPDVLIVCDVVSNTIRSDNGGSADTFGPGDQFLISRPGLPYSGVAHASALRFTLLGPAVLDRVAATGDGTAEPVRILDHRPISRQAHLRLQRAIAYARDEVMAAPPSPATPLLASAVSQFLAAGVLQAYPNTAVGDATATDSSDGTPSTLRRAVAYIESNADLDITLADIARAAYVTPRALQLAFRRHLDTTPLGYLRRVRLDRAHSELRAATAGDGETVSAIAARWGFTHTRFTQQYRAVYGVPPSRTLRG
ncbi:helix-turn-helix transcriptional regulator [Catenuloplanes atrovinosus]|uniref:AraC-like DNA-binding protein n=1 Tax=Catenuloplanes atrovinosus TaxID=137266 RepID=A0AAE3YVF4_9ACTN|nr:helix-turn-helix transcriptional regulator [Catenuloplanes atrovinosus]MDR7279250.1 AraC-like DNA-binding protein [Catenuloplanes atrovinosus]